MDPITAVGAVASILTLAQTAISLSQTLYTLGSAVASASEDVQILADDLKMFAQSLTLLSRLLEDSKSWYSDDVYLLTAKIIRDCADLYVKIDKVLVKLSGNGKSNWKLRVKFVYKEGQIRKLMKRLRDMKGTLATILMSLQVDLQLSLLNISSSSKIQRQPEKPLDEATIENLKSAQQAIQANNFFSKHAVRSKDSVQHVQQLQDSVSEDFSSAQSFVLLQNNSREPLSPARVRCTAVTGSVFASLNPQQDREESFSSDRAIDTTDSKWETVTARSIKSASSVESFKSAVSTQETDNWVEADRAIKSVQSVLHAFRTALNILDNLVDRRMHQRSGGPYSSAIALRKSLVCGDQFIDKIFHSLFLDSPSRSPAFKESNIKTLAGSTNLLLRNVVTKLHMLSAEHEDLQIQDFNSMERQSDKCRRDVRRELLAGLHRERENGPPLTPLAVTHEVVANAHKTEAPEMSLPFIGYTFKRFDNNYIEANAAKISANPQEDNFTTVGDSYTPQSPSYSPVVSPHMLPFPNPPRKRMWRAQSDPFVPSNVPGLCMSDADPVTIPIDFTGNPGDNDVLQNFDFDSFLRQDSPPPNRDYTLNVDALGKHTPRGGQSSVSQPDIDEDPYRIKCICEYSDDDGDTIYCEACDTWQHIKCFYPDQIAHALDTEDHLCADCKPRPLDRQLATERQGQQREMKRINDDEGRKKTQRHTKSHKKKAKCADNQFDSYSSCGKRARSSHRLVNDYDHHHSQKVEKTNAEQVAEYQMNILKNMNCRVRNRKPLPLNQVIVPTFEDLTVGWAGPSPGPTEVQSPSPLLPGIDASSGAQKDVVRPWLPIPMDPSIEDDRPLFVNPKQFDRIVKRRRVRQEQEDSRKRCKQESSQDISDEDISMDQSSLHSGLAPAPPATELVLDASKSVVADARNPPSSGSRIWLQAYENLQASHSSIFGTLAHEFGVFGVEDTKICARLSNLVGLLPKTDFDKIRGTENIFAIRENVIYVVTMVDQQMGLESATIGWCCIWAYVKMYDQIFARHAISPFRENIISKIEVSFLQLLDVTGIIARYAVMENLYQQSGGALSLKEDYQASLISLCESMIRFLAEVYDQGRLFEQVSYTNIPLRTSNVMDEVRRKDEACRAFKVVVDVKEESDSDSEITEEEEGEDLSDGSWEAVEVGK